MILNKIRTAVRKFSFLSAVFIFSVIVSGCCNKTGVTVKYQYPDDYEMWKHIFNSKKINTIIPEKLPSAVIIPHHDITAAYQNSFYKAISQQGQPSVIVLVAPDHFEKGKKQIVIPSRTFFDTPEGLLNLESELVSNFFDSEEIEEYVDYSIKPWAEEHGIYIHTPFIKHYFPESTFFPILLKSFSEEEEFVIYKKLAKVLHEILPQDALVIASVDFSHYQIPRMTELHDYVSMNTIQNLEDLKHIEIDSPESLTVITEYAKMRGADQPVLINRTSTYDFIPDEFIVSTSHQYWTFYSKDDEYLIEDFKENVKKTAQRINFTDYENTKNQTILIGGSGNIGAGIRNFWKWDRYKKSKEPVEQKLYNLAGTEARFLNGFDALIFDIKAGEKYFSNKHKTPLLIMGTSFSDAEKILEKQEFKDNPENQINILVVTEDDMDFSKAITQNSRLINSLLEKIDVVVFRDSKGENDSYAYLKEEEDLVQEYNLGIFVNEKTGYVKGSILCINWYNGKRNIEIFNYENNSAYPPAIYQGEI